MTKVEAPTFNLNSDIQDQIDIDHFFTDELEWIECKTMQIQLR